jgi:hypothetical protein
MADQHPFTKKWHLLPVPVRLGIGLAVVLLAGLALGAALPWMAQAGPTLAGNAPTNSTAPEAIKAANGTGACCVDGTCVVEGVTEDDCEHNYFGTYQGDGTSCVGAGAKCDGSAIGACCLEDGTCEHRTEESCTTDGGKYQGDGADCATADCEPPPTGGCCLPDETCEVRTEASCDSSRGIYLGDDTDCVEVDCDRGACCLPDGSCQDLTLAACYDVAGEYYGDDTDCSSVTCPPPTGACCLPTVFSYRYLTDLPPDYADCEQKTEAACLDAGGSYQGDLTDCYLISCDIGACCLADGSCQETTETLCTAAGGDYNEETDCDPNPCPQPNTGACCLADDSCQILTAVACAISGGTYLGDDTGCDPNPCPPEPRGACCLTDGSCQEITSAACALIADATYWGDGTDCDPNPCPQPPKGACCLSTGACEEVMEALCVEGTYLGDGTGCDPNPCPEPTGACCLGPSGGYACNEVTASECYGNNPQGDHYFQGAGTTCASVNCMPITVIKTADPVAVKEPGGNVTFTVLVINQGTSCSVFIDSLMDDKHGNLDAQVDCDASPANPQEIPPGGSYTCQFTVAVNGAAGYVETDTVTASGEDSYELDDECSAYGDPNNQPISAQGSATVTVVEGLDHGDAEHPINNQYQTLLANNGASHGLGSDVYLGKCVDGEPDGQPTTDADGDDANVGGPVYGTCTAGNDDEDGVTLITCLRIGKQARVNVVAKAACTLSAWIDFDADGNWSGPGEALFPGGQALVAGANSLTFAVPAEAEAGDTYARFRCTTDGAVGFSGSASDGEVEDYLVEVKIPPSCSADFDCSGSVNAADLSILLAQWGACAGCPEDLNGNGQVNLPDLSILVSQWGNCP